MIIIQLLKVVFSSRGLQARHVPRLNRIIFSHAFSNMKPVSRHCPVRNCFPVVGWRSTTALGRSLVRRMDGGFRLLDHPLSCECRGKGDEGFIDDLLVGGIVIRRLDIKINTMARLLQRSLRGRILKRIGCVLRGFQVSIQKDLVLYQLHPSEQSKAVNI